MFKTEMDGDVLEEDFQCNASILTLGFNKPHNKARSKVSNHARKRL